MINKKEKSLCQMIEHKIVSIHLFNNDKVRGMSRAIMLKNQYSRKIRGTYTDLTPLLKRT